MLRTAWATFARAITRTGVAAGATIIAFCSVVRATLTTAVRRAAFLDLGVINQILAGLGQQAVERGGINALEGAEIGHGQGGALKVAQHLNALAASLTFFGLFGFFDGAAALEFILRGLAMLVGDVARRVAIQVKTLGGFGQTNQVAIAAGVATQEGRQHRLGEHAGGSFLFVLFAWRHCRQVALLPTVMFGFICIAAIANRWHYLIDLPAGMLLAWCCAYLGEKVAGLRGSLAGRPAVPSPLRPVPA